MNDTPQCQALLLSIDSNDARAWMSLALKLETELSQPRAVPEGWQCVPKVARSEMIDAAFAATVWPDITRATSSDVMHALRANMAKEYTAMLAAAPQPPLEREAGK